MVRCPNCNHEELPGALFCSDCGAKLDLQHRPVPGGFPDRGTSQPLDDSVPEPPATTGHEDGTIPLQSAGDRPSVHVALHLVDIGEDIPLEDRNEFTLGRVSEGQPLIPEVDLSPYDAYEKGVSRLHAVIGIQTAKITITDLGSANGTWLNGVRVTPHTAHEIKHGDYVTLGTLKMKTIIRE